MACKYLSGFIAVLDAGVYGCIKTCCVHTVRSLFACSAIGSVFRAWIDHCPEDFREPPGHPCLVKLLEFLKRHMPGSAPERRAHKLLEQFQKQEGANDGKIPFPPVLPDHTVPLGITSRTPVLMDNTVRLTSVVFLVSFGF